MELVEIQSAKYVGLTKKNDIWMAVIVVSASFND
jgi:hypothetical protein